jgi:hypothetical protein
LLTNKKAAIDFRWAALRAKDDGFRDEVAHAAASAEGDLATREEATATAMSKAKKAKKQRVQREDKLRALQEDHDAVDQQLEQVSATALAVSRRGVDAKALPREEQTAWQDEESAWQLKELNHAIVQDFSRYWKPLGETHVRFVSTKMDRYKMQRTARRAAGKARGPAAEQEHREMVHHVLPDLIHFLSDRAVEIGEKEIDISERFAWFDVKGFSSRPINSHYWDRPLNLTPEPWTVAARHVPVEAHDVTTLSDEDDTATPPMRGMTPESPTDSGPTQAAALEITHAQAVKNAREKRRQKANTVSKRIESEEANKHYLMTVYDSPTLVQDVSRFLSSGTIMMKHGRSGDPHRRKVWISTATGQREVVWVDPDATGATRSSIPVSQISKITLGCYSKVFKRHPSSPQDKSFYLSFTLSTRDKSRTLDLVADTLVDFEAWVLGLAHLVQVDPVWGGSLDLKDDPQLSQLTQKELFLCQKENMLPAAYLGVKKKVTDHRDDMAHQIRIFNGDAAQAYESVGGIHAPQMNHKGAVLVTKGELRFYSSFWNVDIFRVCKLWQLFREMDIIYDPSYLPATCFGVTQKA